MTAVVPINVGDDVWLEPLGWLATVRTVLQVNGELLITVSLPGMDEDDDDDREISS